MGKQQQDTTLNKEEAEALRNHKTAEVLTTVCTTKPKNSFQRARTYVTYVYSFLETSIVLKLYITLIFNLDHNSLRELILIFSC